MTKDNEPSSPRTAAEQEKRDRGIGLSAAQVTGSALAAMSGAFFASWAGTTGTLIGAAVGSIIATVGAATYTWSLRRTGDAVRRTAAQVRQTALTTNALPRRVTSGPLRDDETRVDHAAQEPDPVPEQRRWIQLPWAKVALASLAVMALGMAGITAIEAVTGKPIASLFGHGDGSGTTVGHVVGSDSKPAPRHESPRKRTPATPSPSPSAKPSEQPSQEPQPSSTPTPSTTPSATPSTPEGSAVPGTGEAPAPTGQPGTTP